ARTRCASSRKATNGGSPVSARWKGEAETMLPTRTTKLVQAITTTDAKVSIALARLRRLVAAVNRPGEENSEFDRALEVLKILSRKEDIPIAIVGGMT